MRNNRYRCEQCGLETPAALFDQESNLCHDCMCLNSAQADAGSATVRSISDLVREAVRSNIYGYLSFTLSGIAIVVIVFLFPAGMRHLDEPFDTYFHYAFFVSIIMGCLGVVVGNKGKKRPHNLLARLGYCLGLLYFVVLFVGLGGIFLIFSSIH